MLQSWYKAQFPEALYPPKLNIQQYATRVTSGGFVASMSKLGVVGLARDNLESISYNLNRISYLSQFFKSTQCIIFENDSTDGTPEYILDYISTQNTVEFHLASTKMGRVRHNPVKTTDRKADMAMYRNTYLELVDKMEWDIDYLMVIDTDLIGGFSYEGILNSLGYENDWSFMGSNGILYRKAEDNQIEKLQFDTWALRHFGSWDDVCGEESNRLSFDRGAEPFRVNSCFGGIGIYKYKDIKGLRYTSEDCDHVTLHKQMIDQGKKLYLNPSQITLYNGNYYTS